MNRWLLIFVLALAALLSGCSTSVSTSTQPKPKQVYSMVLNPDRFTLNAGDWSSVSAMVELSTQNSDPTPISPQPTIEFTSSDPRVTISPNGQVCAGQWDPKFLICSANYITTTDGSGNTVTTLNEPTGYVIITAFNASHDVMNTSKLSIHQRAASITLSADWGKDKANHDNLCLTQNQTPQVKYSAIAHDGSGNVIGNIYDNDYTWSVADSNVAAASSYGYVTARNPGVTNVYARLNGTVSQPLTFATCPPAAIVLASSADTQSTPTPPYSTADLDLNKGGTKYLTATNVDSNGNPLPVIDLNGNPLTSLPLTFISSDILTGSTAGITPLTARLTARTSGRFSVSAACEPSNCNFSVPDYTTPKGVLVHGKDAGFGYPIYSNSIGVTVEGTSGSTVLVTGATLADGVTSAHVLLVYDSESMSVLHSVSLANTPNSLVVAPSGATAYVGSQAGLMVVNTSTWQSSLQTYPVVGSTSDNPEYVTGVVLGVSQDGHYVVVSDTSKAATNNGNGYVYLVDTIAKRATRYDNMSPIRSVTFADDGSNFWLGGDGGVYTFQADTFVPVNSYNPADASTIITGVNSLAWMPDGQSYFASGSQLLNYSTCDDQNPTQPAGNLTSAVTGGLSTTTINGVSHLLGLHATGGWFDYPVTTTSEAVNPTEGFVCLATVTVKPPVQTANSLGCTPTQVTYAPTQDSSGRLSLPSEFITGVDPACTSPDTFIHGYDVISQQEIKIPTSDVNGKSYPVLPISGGLLNDGRKLYFGTFDQSSKTALLHRINFDPTAGPVGEDVVTTTTTSGTTQVVIPASVSVVPSYVAVVPK